MRRVRESTRVIQSHVVHRARTNLRPLPARLSAKRECRRSKDSGRIFSRGEREVSCTVKQMILSGIVASESAAFAWRTANGPERIEGRGV